MNHISEEQLVLFYYGESGESAEVDSHDVESHLEQCEACRSEFRALQLLLNTVNSAPVPERGPEYGSMVWKRIEKQVGRGSRRMFQWWIWAPAMAALVMVSFMAGRLSHRAVGPETTVATNATPNGSSSAANAANKASAANAANSKFRERILLVAVGDHLERSQMILAELTNAPNGQGKLDITDERQTAADLLEDNRLYRQTARSTGDTAVASVLDDLERVLMEIANSPTQVSNVQLDDLRQQIENRGLLFKVRVLGSRVREQENKPAPERDRDTKKL
jgi:hypothetical protein